MAEDLLQALLDSLEAAREARIRKACPHCLGARTEVLPQGPGTGVVPCRTCHGTGRREL